jgi:hypothetical protein
MKKAIKINVIEKSFDNVTVDSLHSYYKEIGNGCDTFCVPVTFENQDSIYCDDNGLYAENIGGFAMKGWSSPIVGNAVVVGTDTRTGDSVDVKTSIEWLKENIIFLSEEQLESYFEEYR